MCDQMTQTIDGQLAGMAPTFEYEAGAALEKAQQARAAGLAEAARYVGPHSEPAQRRVLEAAEREAQGHEQAAARHGERARRAMKGQLYMGPEDHHDMAFRQRHAGIIAAAAKASRIVAS